MASLISHSFMPRSMFNMDYWLEPLNTNDNIGLSTLDLFDPFDELDRMIGRNFNWLSTPFNLEQQPKVPNKYRIILDCFGYSPKSIKTEIKDNQLIVIGNEGNANANENEDFQMKQFRKTYKLPPNTENDKLVSFMTSNGKLVIEIPLKEDDESKQKVATQEKPKYDLFPRISEDKTNVSMNLSLPQNIDPSKLNVVCKDRQLIVKYQDKSESQDSYSDVYFYKQILMPENTDFKSLKCSFDKDLLTISAPLKADNKSIENTIPIEIKQQNKISN
jgi:HSP20 family molecular chaperone IbpA